MKWSWKCLANHNWTHFEKAFNLISKLESDGTYVVFSVGQ